MKIKTKDQVLSLYKSRYPALDKFFLQHLGEEYDRYADKISAMKSIEEFDEFFDSEAERNEQLYRDNANIEGIESSLSDQYMAVMAAYGIIMFFRDNILADE